MSIRHFSLSFPICTPTNSHLKKLQFTKSIHYWKVFLPLLVFTLPELSTCNTVQQKYKGM